MNRPAITKAQIIAAVAAGVPIVTNLLAAFGLFTPTPAEQHALTEATKWATGFAVLLVASDAHLRGKRNEADAAKAVAAATVVSDNAHSDPGPVGSASIMRAAASLKGDEARAAAHRAPEPEPDRHEPDEIDLDDPALDDPEADSVAGVSRSALAEHYGTAAEPGDVAERDARIGASS